MRRYTLNPSRVSDWTDAMMNAHVSRVHGNRKGAAGWLDVAGVIRREAWKPWDYEVLRWVCQCCMLALANGECCASDVHNGDGVEPLSLAKESDSWALGGEHVEGCDRGDDSDCDCEKEEFSQSPCRGCGSTLHGSRYAVTVFVNDRRQATVTVSLR